MTTLVTGGAGFIGSHVCEALLKNKEKVICIDDFNDFYDPRFKKGNIKEFLKNKNFKNYNLDIAKNNKLGSIIKKNKIKKIVHLAARTGIRNSVENPGLYEQVNVRGTLNLLNSIKNIKIENFIFGSSSSVYGNSKLPFGEEDKIDKPLSPYAATKRSGELLCYNFSHLYCIPTICLRFFSVYGEKGRPDMAPYLFTELINKNKEIGIFGDGNSKRDFTYIGDIIEGIMLALDNPFKFEIINLGNSKPVEVKRLISIIGNSLNKRAKIKKMPFRKEEAQMTYADIKRARKLLRWYPKVDIDLGMKSFIGWYLRNRA